MSLPTSIIAGASGHITHHTELHKLLNSAPINVKDPDYNATGDGVADDTVEIQAAVDAAAVSGGVVYFPPGSYKLSSAITVDDFVTLKGSGMTATVIVQSSTTAHAFVGTDTNFLNIQDMMIDGPASGTGNGIHIDQVTTFPFYIQMSNVMVRQFGADGIYIEDAVMSTFINVTSKENGSAGFYFATAGPGGTSVSLITCYAHTNTGNGIRMDSHFYCALVGCGVDNNVNGYKLEGVGAVSLIGCGAEANSTNQLNIGAGCEAVVVDGFWSNSPGGARCIQVTGTSTANIRAAKQGGTLGSATHFIDVDNGSTAYLQDIDPNGLLYDFGATSTVIWLQDGGLKIKESTNGKMGAATLVAGTVTVSTTAVTANSRIFLTAQTSGAAAGALRVSARTAATSFTITSTSGTDTSLVAWMIVEPA